MDRNNLMAVWFIVINILKSFLLIILSSILFFNSFLGVIILAPYGIYQIFKIIKRFKTEFREKLVVQFRDSLVCIQTAMEAGSTIEKSIEIAKENITVMYGKNAVMVKNLEKMIVRLTLNENIETIISDFAEESQVKEIINFADVFSVAKRSGGNVIQLIKAATTQMYEKIEVKREIKDIIAANQTECMVMKIMPLMILLYFRIFSSSFLTVLYETVLGRLVMLITSVFYFVLCEYSDEIISKTEGMI